MILAWNIPIFYVKNYLNLHSLSDTLLSIDANSPCIYGAEMSLIERCFSPRLIEDLKQRAAFGIFFYLLMTVMVLFGDGYYGRHPEFSNTFLLSMVVACALRATFMGLDRFMKPGLLNALFFMAGIVVCGLVWGQGAAEMIIQEDEVRTRFLVSICTICLCSGGLLAYNPSLPLSLVYNLALLGPAVTAVMTRTTDHAFGVLIVVASAYLVATAHRTCREYWKAVENEALLAQKTRDLKQMTRRDGLTGLKNRACFDSTLEYEWKRVVRNPGSLVLLMCDIDHFKQVNDRYGHLAGDEYLKMIACLLKAVFRRETDIVARYGGEEFVVLMPDTATEKAVQKAEEIRSSVENAVLNHGGHRISTTVSIGIAATSMGMTGDRQSLVSMADQCLYQAKSDGRNRVFTSFRS